MNQGLLTVFVALVVASVLATAAAAPPPICVDGEFEDWSGVEMLASDPAGDASGVFDVTRLFVTSRGTRLFLRFDTGNTLNLQSGPGDDVGLTIILEIVDGGRVEIDLRKRAFKLKEPGATRVRHLGWADFKYAALPTCAANEFEARIDLARLGAALGDMVRIDFSGSDQLARSAHFVLETPVAADGPDRDPTRHAGTDLRVVSLNTRRNGLRDDDRRDALMRLIKCTTPDVVAIQEEYKGPAKGGQGQDYIQAVLARGVGGLWHVHKHYDCVVASRRPLKAAKSYDRSYAAAVVDLDAGRSVLVLSVHPKCCGYAGSEEDDRRVEQTQAMIRTIADVRRERPSVSVVVLGDWNSVGSRRPLDLLTSEFTLALCPLRHLSVESVVTWRDEDSEFPPGVLDLVVHDRTLAPRNGFILDTRELGRARLDALGLRTDDSAATDHLLLVADFAFATTTPPARR